MTTIFLTKTNCTNCGKQSTFERLDRVYAVKTPEIVSAILDWDFFKFSCHNCNHMVLIDYPTVVVDEEQKTIIQYCADGNVDVLSMQICSLISEGVNLSEYRIRVVSDIESFVEKVQIVSAGYDDRAIELMKYMNSPFEDGDIQFNYEHMIFTKVGHESYTKVMGIQVCRAKTRGAFSFSKSVFILRIVCSFSISWLHCSS